MPQIPQQNFQLILVARNQQKRNYYGFVSILKLSLCTSLMFSVI